MIAPPTLDNVHIAIIGLGYVGLPLAVEFGRHFPVVGFDVNEKRLDELRQGHDATREASADEIKQAARLAFSNDLDDLAVCNVFIITVPTPVTESKAPDLAPLLSASHTVSQVLEKGDVVVYESTVFPGATEEKCVPVLEQGSGLVFNQDFFAGYSPERVNPGDKNRRVVDIKKITSGSTPETADFVDALYRTIIKAGTHKAESLKVAEAAKVIENVQRDVNIGLVNELALIFSRVGVDTEAVLEAAGTKWNFLPFRPGLVGGHCIGVDPHYLTYKAQFEGYYPEIISAARRLNDGMGVYVADQLIKAMLRQRIQVNGARVLVMGLTFKENCPDLRNTRVVDIIAQLEDYGVKADCYDPWVDVRQAKSQYGIDVIVTPGALAKRQGLYDAMIITVAHDEFRHMGAAGVRALGTNNSLIYDIKSMFDRSESDLRL